MTKKKFLLVLASNPLWAAALAWKTLGSTADAFWYFREERKREAGRA